MKVDFSDSVAFDLSRATYTGNTDPFSGVEGGISKVKLDFSEIIDFDFRKATFTGGADPF